MKPVTVTLERFAPMYGWRNRLLRVDLSAGRIWAQETAPDVPAFLGARGLAAKIVWDEYPEPVDAFRPAQPTDGHARRPDRHALALLRPHQRLRLSARRPTPIPGSRAPPSAPIGAPSSKRPVTMAWSSPAPATRPCRSSSATMRSASSPPTTCGAWTPSRRRRPPRRRLASTQDAGHRPCGRAPVAHRHDQTATTSVAGQGGFGAVMGSKKLKAVSVIGSSACPWPTPSACTYLFRAVGDEVRGSRQRGRRIEGLNKQLEQDGGGKRGSMPAPSRAPRRAASISRCPGLRVRPQVDGRPGLRERPLWRRARRSWLFDWQLGLPRRL